MTIHDRDREGIGVKLKNLPPWSDIQYDCIIHQIVLCAGRVEMFSEVMTNVMETTIYRHLLHCSITCALFWWRYITCATYDDLLLHNYVRWLCKGRVLERFWAIRTKRQNLSVWANTKDFLQNEE